MAGTRTPNQGIRHTEVYAGHVVIANLTAKLDKLIRNEPHAEHFGRSAGFWPSTAHHQNVWGFGMPQTEPSL